ncbi:MAG: carbohydrate ABC transporter permease, partial [Lentisphaeria bacterium]|nr:carbohydrate ABC transporter permease [Lentisphaeria bacterium]
GMYAFLILGAATMIYPFLLMISGSTKSAMDIKFFDAFPRFLVDQDWMYAKHLEGLFNEKILNLDQVYDMDEVAFERIAAPDTALTVRVLDAWQNRGAKPSEDERKKLDSLFRDANIPAMVRKSEYARAWKAFLPSYQGTVDADPASLQKALTAFEKDSDYPAGEPNRKLAAEFEAFLAETEIPYYAFSPGYLHTPTSRTMPSVLRGFKTFLQGKFGKTIDEINKGLGTEYVGWNSIYALPPSCLLRRDKPTLNSYSRTLSEYCKQIPNGLRYYFSPEGFFKKQYLKTQYGMDIAKYNEEHGTSYGSYEDVHLARSYPEEASETERKDWEDFVRNTLALQWVRVTPEALPEYHTFLKAKHQNIQNVNKHYGTSYTSIEDIPLFDEPPESGLALIDWESFITGWQDPETGASAQAAAKNLRLETLEFRFQDWLIKRHGDLTSANQACNTAYTFGAAISMPQHDLHKAYFLDNLSALRREFVTRNYRTVAEYMLFHGRGILNTIIYCSLAVMSALLVNPLAAYAMSRYKMPSSYKILLFLMCTMAFPPMVTSIPNFLMLRNLGLLNTFAALILPGMANGYSIFLLKGFFDAQPQELYESAQLDGASEWVLFWQITMALSKPILAVIALAAFTRAYSNFMFAFVTCQDEKMWTLMVWLYQLQQRSGQAVMYASLIIAAIPTFLIFLFCQNIIMRGIVVPSEK